MSDAPDLDALQDHTLSAIAAASDEGALDAVRVAALGKKGSVSALLATLGRMDPDERKSRGAAINRMKEAVCRLRRAARGAAGGGAGGAAPAKSST